MKALLGILILLPQNKLGQQNLVLNGSFEENQQCPAVPFQWTVSHWESGNDLTPPAQVLSAVSLVRRPTRSVCN